MATQSQSLEPVRPSHPFARTTLACASFALVVLQSVCTFFFALSGLRLVIGIAALASVAQVGSVWDHFHTNWIRIPMLVLAFAGSAVNLAILGRIHRLRRNSAARWRQSTPSPRKLRMERLQFILSTATLALLAVEELTHFKTFHHF